MRSPSGVVTLLVGFVLAVSILVSAQSATTSLHGTVYDSKGAVVSGATVTITDSQTGFSRSAKTGSQGEYQFVQLPPATYVVTAAAAGFATLKEESVRLMVNTPATLNFTVVVQGQTVTVEVQSTAPLVNTTDATLGHAFGTEKLANLPFEGRDPVGILSLQPGVVFIAPKGQVSELQDSRGGSVNGARSDQTNVTLDGVDNNDQLLGFAFQGAVRSTLDSLQEFRVTTSNSNADAGRSSGAQVSLVTKSGTNRFHGSAYEYNRSKIGEANDWFNKRAQLQSGLPNVPPHLVRNTFGATFGGPVMKDRLFFFLAYEGQRTRENQQITRIVPSADLRNGIVSYLACSLPVPDPSHPERCQDSDPLRTITLQQADLAKMDPNCSTPVPGFPNGTCPLGPGANSAVMAIFQQYPLPNTDSVGDGLNYRGFTFSAPAPGKTDTYIAKLDFNLTQNGNHRVFVRGGLNNDHGAEHKESVSQTGDAGPEFPGLATNLLGLNNSKGLTAGYTALLRNNLVNNFRYGFIRQGTVAAGLKNQHFVHFRGLDNIQGFDTSLNTHVPVHNFVDDVNWIKGKHNLQFGGNFRRIDNIRSSDSTSFFTASTNVSWLDNAAIANTGSSLDPVAFGFPAVAESFSSSYDSPVSALAGLVTEVDANYNLTKTLNALPEGAFVPRHFRANELEFYGQDAWRVTPNFTLTFGARYSLLQPPYETTGTQVAPSVSLHDWFNKRGQAMFAGQTYAPVVQFDLSGQANGKQPYWAWDYKDIAPRIAFAWSPSSDSGIFHKLFGGAGKTSIRGGYGIYYDHFGEGITNSFDRNGSFGLTTSISNSAGVQDVDTSARFSDLFTIPTQSAACEAPPCSIVAPPPTGTFPVTPPTTAFAITWGLDDKLKTPYSHVIDFSITRELPHGFVIEASYVGRMAHRLLQEEDLAMPLDIVDPASKVDYFAAATALTKAANAGTDINSLAAIPYWEHLFPAAAGNLGFGPPGDPANLGCAPGNNANAANYTATQAMYDMYSCFSGNETTALFFADLLCLPACSQLPGQPAGGQPFNFFDNQWSSLYSWRSVGNSAYHAAQLSLRHLMKQGLQFDLNYTFSKSIDVGSNAERINQFEGGGFASQIINSWSPNQLRAVSDFDARHQINANWIYELPFGKGKPYASGMNRWANAIVGGWQFSGLLRWSSALPFTVGPGLGFWATNWELTSSAVMNGPRPKTGTFIANGQPNLFKDPATAIKSFRFAFPGESGQRNNVRGPGIFGLDTGLGKSWKITESQAVKFAWEVFNATNSVRFDAATANATISNSSSFGNYIQTLSQKRVMQFSLRYIF
jgi:carboxypeptidase family protein